MADEQNTEGGVVERLRNSPRTVSTIIVILIIAGAIFAFSDRKQNGANPSAEPTAEEPQNVAESSASASPSGKAASTSAATAKPGSSVKETPKPTPLPDAKETAEAYTEVATRGQSITKLARMATKRYIDANASEKDLSNEQRIFVEDYLKDQTNRKSLVVGGEVTFSKDAVRKGIEESKKLTDAQLKNLQKYARNVNWN